MRLTIVRTKTQPTTCMLGSIYLGGVLVWTLERPWVASGTHIGGMPGRSCVPPGIYRLEPHNSEAHPQTFALVNEKLGVSHWNKPGMRSCVLIHPANYVSELRGCIALGMERVHTAQGWTLTNSRVAQALLKGSVPWAEGNELEIIQR